MSDKLTQEQRHNNMAAIRGKDTKPEIIVRKYLWRHGFRYRLNHRRLPGKPDVVLRKYRTCIFVNGCFWHGHNVTAIDTTVAETIGKDCAYTNMLSSSCCKIPKTNTDFWVNKIRRNKERDKAVQKKLADMGWHSVTVWECELKSDRREDTLLSLVYTLNHILLENHNVHRYQMPDEGMCGMVAEDNEWKL